MQQIERETISRKEGKMKAKDLSIFNEKQLILKEGDVCFGYEKNIKETLCLGLKLPIGEVISVGRDVVSLINGNRMTSVKRPIAEKLAIRKKFVIKEIYNGGDITQYELLYYLNDLSKHYPKFKTDKNYDDVLPLLKETLIEQIRGLDKWLFVTTQLCDAPYTNEDITLENLERGKRYRKLVFVRNIGCILSKLFFPDINLTYISQSWGYANHTSLYHAQRVMRSTLNYDKKMSHVMLEVLNDTVRQVRS